MSLDVNSLAICYDGGDWLFPPLSFSIAMGEIGALIGASGCGKSSILHAIGGHLPPQAKIEGTVILNEKPIDRAPPEKRGVGLLFQDALLFPHLSVGENLAMGLRAKAKNRREIVEDALNEAGLASYFDRDPASLSGGQAARAALMRTLLAAPEALLLDEPFSKLDPELRSEIRNFTFTQVRNRNIPCLIVTHDQEDINAAAGQVIKIQGDDLAAIC